MLICHNIKELQNHLNSLPDRKVSLIPTMGALHAGHTSLIDLAREKAPDHFVVTSIFVNPLQFDNEDDLDNYPKTLEDDLTLCEKHGTDIVFLPTPADFYAADHSIMVTESSLSKHLCGDTRPGHFNGVCTVVMKLFMSTRADLAVFGEKDFQQIAIIRRMVRDLHIPIQIVEGPTAREDGILAMSSRNERLTKDQREHAHDLYRALIKGKELAHLDMKSKPESIINHIKEELAKSPINPPFKIDYLDLVDNTTLDKVDKLRSNECSIAIAAFVGSVRLIDHISI